MKTWITVVIMLCLLPLLSTVEFVRAQEAASELVNINIGRYITQWSGTGLPESSVRGFPFTDWAADRFSNQSNQIGPFALAKNYTNADGQYIGHECSYPYAPPYFPANVIRDENGDEIVSVVRYKPTEIILDGRIISAPFTGHELAPEKLPGTAEQMLTFSYKLANLGLRVDEKVLMWGYHEHNNYVIIERIITNTGDCDFDPEIELPNQTIEGMYISFRHKHGDMNRTAHKQEGKRFWVGYYGNMPGDTLRLAYTYDSDDRSTPYDSRGYPLVGEDGRLVETWYTGLQILHVDKSPSDESHDPEQPITSMSERTPERLSLVYVRPGNSEVNAQVYDMAENATTPIKEGTAYGHHQIPGEERPPSQYAEDGFPGNHDFSPFIGPYDLGPGEDIRIVVAAGGASLAAEVATKVGRDWLAGKCTFDGEWNSPLLEPENPNDWAKDAWLNTVRDSLFQTMSRAKRNYESGYNIPAAPPPPAKFTITSLPGGIKCDWTGESESASGFQAYKLYRRTGLQDTCFWTLIYKGKERTFTDVSAIRGNTYYYTVTASDGKRESSPFYVEALYPAQLTKAAGESLDEIRVVPNPFNSAAPDLQYSEIDRIMFLGLPLECAIRIYNEVGELMRTLEHYGSGDEPWDQQTETGQVVVSGIYLAHIEISNGESTIVKFAIVR